MINRHQLYKWFKQEHDAPDCFLATLSDQFLAEQYGLTVIRKGYFNRANAHK